MIHSYLKIRLIKITRYQISRAASDRWNETFLSRVDDRSIVENSRLEKLPDIKDTDLAS